MASKSASQSAAGVSGLLAVLVLISLIAPWKYQSTESGIFRIQVSLHSVTVEPGGAIQGAAWLVGKLGFKQGAAAVDAVAMQDSWIEDAIPLFCSDIVEYAFKWCDSWQRLRWACILLAFFSFIEIVFLVVGAVCSVWYTHEHSTHTGRMWIRASFLLAPAAAFFGMTLYTMLTYDFGLFDTGMFADAHTIRGVGYVSMWTLTILSWTPLFIHGFFSKVARDEKRKASSSSSSSTDSEMADKGSKKKAKGLKKSQQAPPPPFDDVEKAGPGPAAALLPTPDAAGPPPSDMNYGATGGPTTWGTPPPTANWGAPPPTYGVSPPVFGAQHQQPPPPAGPAAPHQPAW